MKLTLIALLAISAFAQDLPPINGTVTEAGTNAGIAAAEVIFYEFATIDGLYQRKVVSTVVTDGRGGFVLRPEHPGAYYVEAKKPTYLTGQEINALGPSSLHVEEMRLDITREPVPDIKFILVRPGGIAGRVVDEEGKPVPNFTVTAPVSGIPLPLAPKAVSDADGKFAFTTLLPSPRTIRVAPAADPAEEDIETTYWPGGVNDPTLALPIKLVPGAVVDIGTIRLRKIRYYRARVTYAGDCVEGESWGSMLVGTDTFEQTQGCAKTFVVSGLRPGEHRLAIWGRSGLRGDGVSKWAMLPISIDRDDVDLALNFTPSTDVPVRVVNAGTAALPPLANMRVVLRGMDGLGSRVMSALIDPTGNVTIPAVPWLRQQVEVLLPGINLAVKEFRYNGQLVPDGVISIAPGAPLEVVMDDQPASVTATAPPSTWVYLARWPFVPVLQLPYVVGARTDAAGQRRFGSLAAGEYRVIALPAAPPDVQTLGRLLSTASRITLERGAQQTIELKLSDPTR